VSFEFLPFAPGPDLEPILDGTFFARGRIPYRSDKILPTGLIPVLFTLGAPHRMGKSVDPALNEEFAHSWLEGLQTTPTFNTPTDGTHVIGLLFEPVGLHALFGVDMRTLRDRTVDARSVLPARFIAGIEAVYPEASTEAGHAQLRQLIAEWPRSPLPGWLWRLYREIKQTRGDIDLAGWYAEAGVGARAIVERFKRAVGVPPKRFCRIHRMLALLEAVDPREAGRGRRRCVTQLGWRPGPPVGPATDFRPGARPASLPPPRWHPPTTDRRWLR